MSAENSEIRLKKLEAKVDQMHEVARDCVKRIDKLLAIARGQNSE